MNTQQNDIRGNKKVLIVTYYWPPSGGAGVQRFLKFTKYLPEFGVTPYVLTCSTPTYPILDRSLHDEVSSDINIFKARSLEPFSLYGHLTGTTPEKSANPTIALGSRDLSFPQRISRWIRANLFIPDARAGWVPFARKKALQIVRTHHIDTIITTGPPHSTHFIGSNIKRKTGITWIADFRDPWTDIHYNQVLPRTALTRAIDRRLETRILQQADCITVTAPGTASNLSSHVARKYHVLTNGYDPDDFSADLTNMFSPDTPEQPADPSVLTVRHIGSITETSVPVNLFKALSGMRNMPVRLEFTGSTHPAVEQFVHEYKLNNLVATYPYVPHKKAVQFMKGADVNVVVVHRSTDSRILIPGKLYDYLNAGKPIMVIGPTDGDAAEIVNQCKIGKAFGYDDVDGPADWLRTLLEHKLNTGSDYTPFQPDLQAIKQYSRHNISRQFAAIIHQSKQEKR